MPYPNNKPELKDKRHELTYLRDTLLPKLMGGEVRGA
jgi:hypothetical protein